MNDIIGKDKGNLYFASVVDHLATRLLSRGAVDYKYNNLKIQDKNLHRYKFILQNHLHLRTNWRKVSDLLKVRLRAFPLALELGFRTFRTCRTSIAIFLYRAT